MDPDDFEERVGRTSGSDTDMDGATRGGAGNSFQRHRSWLETHVGHAPSGYTGTGRHAVERSNNAVRASTFTDEQPSSMISVANQAGALKRS